MDAGTLSDRNRYVQELTPRVKELAKHLQAGLDLTQAAAEMGIKRSVASVYCNIVRETLCLKKHKHINWGKVLEGVKL